MRIVVVGAGALGGLVGALLSASGKDVTFLEINRARAGLLNREGLLITEDGRAERRVDVKVVDSIDGIEQADLIFVSVKSYQTEAAVRGVLPVVGEGSRMLSMQNGIGNTQTMASIIGPEKVLSGITYHSIQHMGPNSLRFRRGIKPIQIAPYQGKPTPGIENIGEVFNQAGLDTEVVENIEHVVWQKLLHNAVVNPVSALTGLDCNQLLEDDDLQDLMRDLCTEIVAVMRARGVPIIDKDDPYRPLIGSQKALGPNRPTMWQDLDRGLRTEIDALNGAIVEEAERRGLGAPCNSTIVHLIHAAERRARGKRG
ncbi:MAG TPA: 2-dehydropantoate 2-reductase [Myxococcota bacterium]|nr:2-dehydropantoate 2-reductase [Myxococcota bacterium]